LAHDFIDAALFTAPSVSERLDGNVESDLVPEFEAVGHGSRWGGDAYMRSFDGMLFDTDIHGARSELKYPQSLPPGEPFPARDSHPDFMRGLGGQLVES